MSWTVIFLGFAACLATALTGYFIHERRQRAAFVAKLGYSAVLPQMHATGAPER